MEGTENTQWIEDYLDGVLGEADMKRFEEKLISDPDFEKEVNAQRMVRESFERAELKEFFKQINESTKEVVPAASKKPFSFGILAIAASVILAIGISLYFLFNETTKDLSQNELVADSFKIEVNSSLKSFKSEDPSDHNLRSKYRDIEVNIIESTNFKNHYSFNNYILNLYFGKSKISKDQIKIYYAPFKDIPYEIEIQGKNYLIEENSGPEPKPLTLIQE